jgi:hypothetical protein
MEQAVVCTFRKMLHYRAKTVPKLAKPIAGKGLVAAVPALAFCWLCAFFPDVAFLKAVFGVSCLAFFAYAISCAGLLFSGEMTGGAGKIIETGWRYSRRLSDIFKMPKNIVSVSCRRFTNRARTNSRSHRSASRPRFARSSKSGSGDGESDQGDPPGPSYPQHFVTPNYSNSKLNSALPRRRVWPRSGCLRSPCHKRTAGRCGA